MAEFKGILVILVLTVVSLVMIPMQWIALKLGLRVQRTLPHIWHRIATRLVGIRVHQIGTPARHRPLLVTSNHASWVDITVIGSLAPLSFIAKSEVSGWPIFGLFAKLQRTVFVEREKRSKTGAVADQIAERMGNGDMMVLFAEGTSNDGNSVLPFRSALLGAATRSLANGQGDKVWVQPLSIAYQGLYGIPMGRAYRPYVAWYGDMELAGHLWGIFRRGALDVMVRWGEPIEISASTDRKALTRQLETQVRAMTIYSLTQSEPWTADPGDIPDDSLFSSGEKPSKAGAETA